jgi:hypothetical protein
MRYTQRCMHDPWFKSSKGQSANLNIVVMWLSYKGQAFDVAHMGRVIIESNILFDQSFVTSDI